MFIASSSFLAMRSDVLGRRYMSGCMQHNPNSRIFFGVLIVVVFVFVRLADDDGEHDAAHHAE